MIFDTALYDNINLTLSIAHSIFFLNNINFSTFSIDKLIAIFEIGVVDEQIE